MNNPLLSELQDVFPPVEIALPTRGIFYPKGVLGDGVDANCIAVHTLGIMDEFKYRDPFLMVSGKAIHHLLHHICGEQILLPEELCEIDVEAILLASRIASYGPKLKLNHTCTRMREKLPEGETSGPTESVPCGHQNVLQLDLHEFILRYGPIENETRFEVKLPKVGQTVYLRPTPYRTTLEVMRNVMGNRQKLENLQSHQDEFIMDPELFMQYEDMLRLSADLQIQTLLDCIWAVRTRAGHLVEDPREIMAWIFELPKSDHDVIAKRISELTEDFRKISIINYTCDECHQENEFNLQMNAEILFLAGSEESDTSTISSDTPPKNKNSFRNPSRILRKSRSPSTEPSAMNFSAEPVPEN